MIEDRERRFVVPAYAIADAMMVSQAYQYDLHQDPSLLGRVAFLGEEGLDKFQQRCTSGGCNQAIRLVLSYLANNALEQFSAMALIEGNGRREKFNGGWAHHQFFLARDYSGAWYGGSPANYTKNNPERLTQVFSSHSIEDVIGKTKKAEGGLWPTPDFIEDIFNNHEYRLPKIQAENRDRNIFTSIKIIREIGVIGDTQRVFKYNLYPVRNKRIII